MDSEIEPGSLGSSSLGSLNVCSQMMVRTGRAGRLKGVGTWWSISLFSWNLKTFRVVPFFFFFRIHTKKHLLGTNHGPKKRTSLVAQTVKRLPTVQETRVQCLGQEDPLEKEMATHSSTLAWKIPWTEEPGRLQSMGSQRVGHDWATSHTYIHGPKTVKQIH